MSDRLVTLHSGRKVDLLSMNESDICIEDIAHALARICRFGGHINKFYSVAQHSLLVSAGVRPAAQLEALLHDATEAYIGDIITPLKRSFVFKEYRKLEDELSAVIAKKFGLATLQWADEIKRADMRAFNTEWINFKDAPPDPELIDDWGIFGNPRTKEPLEIRPLSSVRAEENFLKFYHLFQGAR